MIIGYVGPRPVSYNPKEMVLWLNGTYIRVYDIKSLNEAYAKARSMFRHFKSIEDVKQEEKDGLHN